MESERAGLYERQAETLADAMVTLIKILMRVFVRVRQKMPFEDWFDIYMEEQGYRQEEFMERMNTSREEFESLPRDDQHIVFLMAVQRIPNKIEKLEIPEAIKEFFSSLIKLIPSPTVEQPPVYECDDCHQQFTITEVDFEKVRCPDCGREWAVEELTKLIIK